MEIEKEKIIEIWNSDHNKVTKYTQIIKNNSINEFKKIEAKSLSSLMNKVRDQVIEWNFNNK
ncbi:hypothetical protein [Clostridium septicum]|uniref:Uncharacterized protein n=1 Tax=Clostridium septicum TaxID=1504 RepID=A0A9N7PKD2_CLOSE|nr:hypothetical protein [Clostridium septicum]AYE35726.1 hypothetical protein CP523_15505 [Clostridium septicum]MDU1314926.1 hypothetical protein [Clostridium septicum]QAS61065.1 hypothetical protein EI377_10210 [Clostridium septicum]UEC19600.1 hypothetical protein LK444_09195 [Clostridium septicum]USS02341.1 hypothetical protein NH397_07985 [Clostridium septicum]